MRLLQIAQHVENLQRATEFYTMLLAMEPSAIAEAPGLVFFDLAGVRLMLDPEAPSAQISFQVDNVHEALERLAGLADIVRPSRVAFTHPDGTLGPAGHEEWEALIADSEGNTIGLIAFQRP